MMKKQLYFSTVLFIMTMCLSASTMAQYNQPENNIWAFGNQMGMNFSGPNPFPVSTSIVHGEGCASVCSPNGQLLFYSNGNKVWAANGSVFPNGQNLDIPALTAMTTTQTALIVPAPGQSNKYYLFTLGGKLFCYKIDMALNNGLGDIDVTFPLTHVALKDSLSEKMIAIRGCNNNVWVVVKPNYLNRFYAFNITTQGVDTTAVVSYAGYSAPQSYFQQTMAASPDGNKIVANASNSIELFNFDKTNGKVSNYKRLDNKFCYGSCFSPNGRFLYTNAADIHQYDLLACDPAATRIKVGTGFVGDIKLAPNGKIYFRAEESIPSHNFLGSIERPDVLGAGCQFRDSVTGTAMPILDPTSSGTTSLGLTNTVVKASQEEVQLNRRYFDSCVCRFPHGTGFDLQAAAGFQNYQWSDGSTGATLNVKDRGTYWVSYATSCGRRTDTFLLRGNVVPVTLTFTNPLLHTSGSYASYEWYKNGSLVQGADSSSLLPATNGTYAVLVTDTAGCTDSAYINVTLTSIGQHATAALNVSVYPNPSAGQVHIESQEPVDATVTDMSGRTLQQVTRVKEINLRHLSPGIYLLKLTDDKRRTAIVKLIRKSGD